MGGFYPNFEAKKELIKYIVLNYLSLKFSPAMSQELERRYESELLRALDADNQGTSTFISPQTFYGEGV